MLSRLLWTVVIIAACCNLYSAAPVDTPSFIASLGKSLRERRDTIPSETDGPPTSPQPQDPAADMSLRIRRLHVTSSVTARFTKTVVTSHIANPADKGQEVNFYMELPKEAFISGFLIESDGQVYQSRVDEKAKAQAAYEHAKSQGQTTGQVKQTSEEKNDFTISINVEARGSLSFNLTYEELLKRKDGHFENSISLSPGQLVESLVVNVHILEPQGIVEESVDFFVKKLDTANGNTETLRPGWAQLKTVHRDRANVQFYPTVEEQRALSANGNLGKFVVQYDVIHEQNAGEIQIVNGYFVHHFSPGGFKPTQKNVVFVLDTSGSMRGRKIEQTIQAMEIILSDLREKDTFNIVTFSSSVRAWWDSMLPANSQNVKTAKERIRELYASGGTNLHGGIVEAITLLENAEANAISTVGTFSLIIMLTDGQPTAGVTSTTEIKTNIRKKLEGRFSLFSLGFGNGVDYPFLEQLSLQNCGLARKIYEDSDARLQLVGFFDEVATPLLVNVKMKYDDNMIKPNSISESAFPTYFEGTELVVAGQLADNESLPDIMTCVVTAESGGVEIALELEVNVKQESDAVISPHAVDDFAQRLWAFLTIKELLRKRIAADGANEVEALTQRALELSLRYHFVTPLTSLVVVKPDDDIAVPDVEPEEDDRSRSDVPSQPQFIRKRPSNKKPKSFIPHGPVLAGPSGGQNPPAQGPPAQGPPARGRGLSLPVMSVSHHLGPPALVPSHISFYSAPWIYPTASHATQTHRMVTFTRTPTTTVPPTTTTAPTTTATTATPTSATDPQLRVRYEANIVIRNELSNDALLCFSLPAKPGQQYKLIEDLVNDILVVGEMASAYSFHQDENEIAPLILSRLLINIQGSVLEVTTETVSIGPTLTMPWGLDWQAATGGVRVAIRDGYRLAIHAREGNVALIVTKRVGDHAMNQSDFLGIRFGKSPGLSDQVDGILGQFQLTAITLGYATLGEGELIVGSRQVGVSQMEKKDLREDKPKPCWWFPGGEDILSRDLELYRVN